MEISPLAEIKAISLQRLYNHLRTWPHAAATEAYKTLSPEQQANIAQYARQLREYMEAASDEPISQVLTEIACLVPGVRRGKPSFMADQSPTARPMYESELREGREWLLQVSNVLAAIRKLTAEEWELVFPHADIDLPALQSADSPDEIVIATLDGILSGTADYMNLDARLCEAYSRLSEEAGRELTSFALRMSSIPLQGTSDLVEDVVAYIACFLPGALKDLQYELAQREIFSCIGAMYKNAEPRVSALLIQRLDEGTFNSDNLNTMLVALAWIADENVRSAFRRWDVEPPTWRKQLYVSPVRYAHEAAWELTASGEKQVLVSEVCYPLLPSDSAQGPVTATIPTEAKCGRCGTSLVTLLDLDLTDRRLGFLEIPGERLRIASCDRCGIYSDAYFTEIDLQGKSEWSSLNEGANGGLAPEDELFYSVATVRLALSSEPRGPLISLVCGEESSQIGGYPAWEQDAQYPRCARCGRTMKFIGQLATGDFLGEPADGKTFCLVCPEYHMAATVYQQT